MTFVFSADGHIVEPSDLLTEGLPPSLRGHGIGKALLRGLARRCVTEGLARLEWSVLDWNAPSIGFYKSLGAVAKDEWTVYRLSGEPLARLAR